VNGRANAFSTLHPATLKTASDLEACRRLQRVLKPMLLLDWSAGAKAASDGQAEIGPDYAMSGIQQQKGIPGNLRQALESLIAKCAEAQASEESQDIPHTFEVRDSTGLLVCSQQLVISNQRLRDMDEAITDGQYDWARTNPANAPSPS
jgi:hypothetical protein